MTAQYNLNLFKFYVRLLYSCHSCEIFVKNANSIYFTSSETPLRKGTRMQKLGQDLQILVDKSSRVERRARVCWQFGRVFMANSAMWDQRTADCDRFLASVPAAYD